MSFSDTLEGLMNFALRCSVSELSPGLEQSPAAGSNRH